MKNYKIILIFLFLSNSVHSFAQKEDQQWIYHFGRSDTVLYPEFVACVLDFNSLPPISYKHHDICMDIKESHASICDDNGQLLFYSNAQTVHGSNHKPILEGDTINHSRIWDVFTFTTMDGVEGPTGFRGAQQVGFIPQPTSDTILVLYHDASSYSENTDSNDIILKYSKIVSNSNGVHKLIEKDKILNEHIRVNGKLTACKHGNGRDWWLLQFSRNTIYTYLIDVSGIHLSAKQLLPFELRNSGLGQAKFSPQGDRFGLFGVSDSNSASGMEIMIVDFDRCNGSITNPQIVYLDSSENFLDNGLEFSPNGDLLYFSAGLTIQQFDLTQSDLIGSLKTVAEYNGITNCSVYNGEGPFRFGQMQLAPDNKIYISLAAQCNDVHVIHSPDLLGMSCNMEQNAIILPTFTMGTIPNFNTYRLGPLDGSACDTLGIDNNPVSRFWYEQDSLDFLTVQFWDVSYFRPESWNWDFGDGNISTTRHATHSYSEKGVYDVCLTVSNENSEHTSCQTLFLGVSSAKDITEQVSVSLFPNPTEDKFRIVIQDYLPEDGRLTLYDLSGIVLISSKVRTGATIVDISAFSAGTYIYELRDGKELLGSGQVVRL